MTPAPHPTPPACAAALAYLQRQLDGDAPDLPPAVEDHLEACADCRERCQLAPDLLAGLPRLDSPQPSPLFTERLLVALGRDECTRQRSRRRQLAGALAAAALLAVWLNWPRPEVSAPTPTFVQNNSRPEPLEWRRSVTEAGEAMVGLTQRAAREAVGDGRIVLPEVPLTTQPWPDLEPAAAPLADARQGLAEGFEPLTTSARRAARLLLRDLPLEGKD
jgi:hypothetical protein